MKKKLFKFTALALSGMLAVHMWSYSFESKADGTLTDTPVSTEHPTLESVEEANQTGISNQVDNSTVGRGGGSEGIQESEEGSHILILKESDLTGDNGVIKGFANEAEILEKIKADEITVVQFPSQMNGQDVIEIAAEAFKKKAINKEIKLPERLLRIGKSAFEESGIKGALHLPETVNWIEPFAFTKNKITSVKLPDNLGPMGWGVFEDNEIETLDLGALKSIKGSRWGEELNYEIKGLISYRAFKKNKIKKLVFPSTSIVWGLGNDCFSENEIEELTIPAGINNIYYSVFSNNKKLTRLTFEERSDAGRLQIDGYAFNNCNITGTLILPSRVNEIGGLESFADNKIVKLVYPQKGIFITGFNTFARNPIQEVENFRVGYIFQGGEFSDTKALKNFSFDNFHSDKPKVDVPGSFDVGGYEDQKRIPYGTFKNGLLKSLEIPKHIVTINDSAFTENLGWLNTDDVTVKKVALYRKDGLGNYVTDNAVVDDKNYVINPVLVEVKLINQFGEMIEKELTLNGSIARKKGDDDTKLENIQIEGKKNWENFKLGDSYSFVTPKIEGLELREVDGKKIEGSAPSEITVEISTENGTKEEKYDDTYKVGYMKKVLTLAYFDKDAKKDPIIPDPIIPDPIKPDPIKPDPIKPDPIIPDPIIPDPTIPEPVIPTPTLPNLPTPPVEVVETETVSEVVPEVPNVVPEEVLLVEEAEIPESPATILPTDEEVENLDILGDEIPQGKTEIKKDNGKKVVSKNILAKTGGLQNVFFYVLSGLVILLAAFGFIEVLRKRKMRN